MEQQRLPPSPTLRAGGGEGGEVKALRTASGVLELPAPGTGPEPGQNLAPSSKDTGYPEGLSGRVAPEPGDLPEALLSNLQ